MGNNIIENIRASDIDKRLKLERSRISHIKENSLIKYPDGTIVAQMNSSAYYLLLDGNMHKWSFDGYGPAMPISTVRGAFNLITPLSTVKALSSGYTVQIHPSIKPA